MIPSASEKVGRVLITNDDGINAPGLKVLEEIAAEIADEVWVFALIEIAQDSAGL